MFCKGKENVLELTQTIVQDGLMKTYCQLKVLLILIFVFLDTACTHPTGFF